MKHIQLVILLFAFSVNLFAAKEIKFKVEELTKPEKLLSTTPTDEIIGRFFAPTYEKIKYPINMLARSAMPEKMVTKDYHSFFNGLYSAYSDHRPFVLSPDMIWLLISQGFAQHVSANAETLRHSLVNFDGKMTLIVRNDKLKLNSPASEWEKVFPEFTKQMERYTSPGLVNLLTSNFSTTTPVERIASQITVMNTFERYFIYVLMRVSCGIPEITLKGTPEDWQSIYDRTKQLAKYDLAWWTDELEPVLKQLIETSKGHVDVDFWKNMYRCKGEDGCISTEVVDGWIVKFFPYDKKGKRNNLKELRGRYGVPEEIVKVNLEYVELNPLGDTIRKAPLELWSGFMGLDQNESDFTLTPVIGWMVRKKDSVEFIPDTKNKDSMFGQGEIRLKLFDSATMDSIKNGLKKLI